MLTPDGLIEIVLGAPDEPFSEEEKDMCAPGHHGPVKGPSDAEEALIKIKCIILEYFGEKCEEDSDGIKEKLGQPLEEEPKEKEEE